MDVLTLERAKPALPFAGSYQLLDFSLSNLVNSGISDVWLSVQYQASALEEQAHNGRPWDLDRTRGGLRLLVPQQGSGSMDEEGFAKGNADELYRLRDQIRRADPELVVVMSADHVYRLDYREVIATHREKGAEVTEWTGGGLHAPTNPAENEGPECTIVLQVQDGEFVRYAPATVDDGEEGYDCDPANVADLEGDYSASG